MKQSATQLITLIFLATCLLGAAVSYLVFADSSSSRQDSNNDVSTLEIEADDANLHVGDRAVAKKQSAETIACKPSSDEFCKVCTTRPSNAGQGVGPTPAFPVKLPPLPRGHTIEVGVEFDQVLRK